MASLGGGAVQGAVYAVVVCVCVCVMFSAGVSGHVAGDRASYGAYRGPKLETKYRSKNLVGENLLLDLARWPLTTRLVYGWCLGGLGWLSVPPSQSILLVRVE